MMVAVELVLLGLLILAATGTLAYWATVAYHVVRMVRTVPTARAGLALPLTAEGAAPPRVCAIVPAHDEEACIADVARTLAGQDYPSLSCVFVLDRCTDRTRAVLEETWKAAIAAKANGPGAGAAAPSMEILELDRCLPGWSGKPHALHRGVTGSTGANGADLLLFIDADTWLHPGAVRATVALMRERGAGMLSLLSTLTHDRWFERLIQPAATMELLRQYPLVRANSTTNRRAFANGQYILIQREAYERFGGHEALREAVLEDVEMARRCEWHNVPVALLLADGLLDCRMYESYAAFRRGWKRIYTESTNRKPSRLRKVSRRVRLVCTIVPVLSAAAIGVGIWRLGGPHPEAAILAIAVGALGSLAFWAVIGAGYVLGRCPLWATPGFVIGSWLVGGILNEAARDLETGQPMEWAGMAYTRESR